MPRTEYKNYNKFHKKILYDMYYDRSIGGRHTSIDNVIKGFRKSDKGDAKDAVKDLLRLNLIIPKNTSEGMHVSLNHDLIKEIEKIIRDV